MQLNKFGAILKYALELERKVVALSEAAAEAHPSEDLQASAAAARKRLARLEIMQRELVNEMLLEPISDFDQPSLDEIAVSSAGSGDVGQRKAQIDQAAKQFYAIASSKIATVAPGLSRAFKKMADQL